MSSRVFPVVLFALLAGIGSAHAAGPEVGGWRNLPIGPAYSVSERKTPFVMLPTDVARGTRFKVMDLTRWQAVCCLEVTSPRLQYDTLVHSYQVPGVWASDLDSGPGSVSGAGSHVFAARAVDRLAGYAFDGHFSTSGEMGGLLLPADARVAGKDRLVIGGTTYGVVQETESLADDDGASETYQLTPEGGGAALTVDVRYGTN